MKKNGVVIYAHNNREIDFSLMAMVSAFQIDKNLSVPVSLITDKHTINWMKESKIYSQSKEIFDQIIEVEVPISNNLRKIIDGNTVKMVPFANANRHTVWEVTPYERTLLVDSDFLVLSDTLNQFWETDSDLLISPSMHDVRGDRIGVLDKWVSETGIPLFWATTVMFTKNDNTKLFFDLVAHIRDHYDLYARIYRFNPFMYRNDISFSIAKHILDGFLTNKVDYLPPVFTIQDRDTICNVNKTGIKVLIYDSLAGKETTIVNLKNIDIHIMNKQDIVKFSKEFMEI